MTSKTEGERLKDMHRRAQKAEGAVKAAMVTIDLWEKTFFPGRTGRDFAMLVINDVRKALGRASK